jgi:hypothetical protein
MGGNHAMRFIEYFLSITKDWPLYLDVIQLLLWCWYARIEPVNF